MIAVTLIIPAFNRVGPLRETLLSAAAALRRFGRPAEILLVDDGSSPPLEEQLAGADFGWPITFLRQTNQGSIIARQTGLSRARGEWILFLDSDDWIPPEKFTAQLGAPAPADLDIVYADMARGRRRSDGSLDFGEGEKLRRTSDPAEFFLRLQPAPHNPLYRRSYLQDALARPLIPTERRFDAAGDVWLYYCLCHLPARIGKVDAPLAAAGVHSDDRYSLRWEKLGAAALGVMEAFAARCPRSPETTPAHTLLGERAFLTWRGLPRGFCPPYRKRMLTLWKKSPRGPLARLGGGVFQSLARVLGPELAGRLLRLRNPYYASVRTLDAAAYDQFVQTLARA